MCPPLQSPLTFLNVIQPWQTSIAASIAFLAAVLAVWNTSRTLKSSRQLEYYRRSRKQAAVRAVLPMALSEMSDYSETCVDALFELLEKCENGVVRHDAAEAPEFPAIPDGVIESFSDFIEFSGSDETAIIEFMIRRTQVHWARLRDLRKDFRNKEGETSGHYIETLIIGAAVIYATASACFDYSRGKQKSPPNEISWDEVKSALNLIGYWDFDSESLHTHLARLKDADASFESI